MNYVQLINRFWQKDLERPISPSDTRLYFFLVHTCNQLGWKNPFGQSDRYLSTKLGMSVNTVREAKNRLMQTRLIVFNTPIRASKGIEGQTQYWLTVSDNDTVINTVNIPSVSKNDMDYRQTVSKTDTDMNEGVSETVSPSMSETVSEINTVPETNDKLNQTKQNYNTDTVVSGTEKKSSSSIPKEEKKKGSAQKRKEEREATPHWQQLVEVWFTFYEHNLKIKPSFSGSDPRALKGIIDNLQKRAIEKEYQWTEEVAIQSFQAFLFYAYCDGWLKNNFLLPNLQRQFDKIVTNATNGGKQQQRSSNKGSVDDLLDRINSMPD